MRDTRFEVFAISRDLLLTLGINAEQVTTLTDTDMAAIANLLAMQYQDDFAEQVRFTTRTYLVEKGWNRGSP